MRLALRRLLSDLVDWTHPITLPRIDDSELPLLEVTSGYLRLAVRYAEAATILIDAGLTEQTGPIERALWEVRCELVTLARRGERAADAVRVQVFDLLELIDGLSVFPGDWSELQHEVLELLSQHELRTPDIVAAMRTQRSRSSGRKHWSGKRRADVYSDHETTRQLYRALSWETHPGWAVHRHVTVERSGDTASVAFDDEDNPEYAAADKAAGIVAKLLWEVWHAYAGIWNVRRFGSVSTRTAELVDRPNVLGVSCGGLHVSGTKRRDGRRD